MPRRFFSQHPISSDIALIEGDEAKHILAVNRLAVGDELILFDGSGREFAGKISETQKRSLTVEIIDSLEVSRENKTILTLAVALPKGDRQKQLVEKLVEVGVHTLIPLNCSRSVVTASEKSVVKLKRRIIEASKQCGRNVLMQISPPQNFADLVQSAEPSIQKFVAHPIQDSKNDSPAITEPDGSDYLVAVGPEGGFSDEEVEFALAHDWQAIRLAPAIMRVETAALVAAVRFGLARA